MSVNRAIIVGNLGQTPELRRTSGGKAVCDLSVATNESYTDRDGVRHDSTEWHRVVVWGKTAESCTSYLAKGRQVYVEGRIQTRAWDDRDGQKRYTTEIVASRVHFLGGRGEGDRRVEGAAHRPEGVSMAAGAHRPEGVSMAAGAYRPQGASTAAGGQEHRVASEAVEEQRLHRPSGAAGAPGDQRPEDGGAGDGSSTPTWLTGAVRPSSPVATSPP